ncbi:hypothetical protein MASR1M36_12310 [Candidatus Cloacimonadaceae bacterium]
MLTELRWIDALPVPGTLKSGGGPGYKHPASGTEYYYLFGGNTGNQSTHHVIRFDINHEGGYYEGSFFSTLWTGLLDENLQMG